MNPKLICNCGNKKHFQSKVCSQCHFNKRRKDAENTSELTIGDKVYTKHKYAKYSYIRYHARKIAIANNLCECQKCGYDKHFEVCHKEPISSYPPDTKISHINRIENLISL
ncbi:MAG TPA: hypothetical protein V6C58_16570, partial [Allocoleopsis sp.]